MRPPHELAHVRQVILSRRKLHAEARDLFSRLSEFLDPGSVVLDYHCQQPHRRGRSAPTLAKAYPIDSRTILFVGRIEWRPADLLRPTPWERERRLGACQGSDDTFERLMTDDALLSNALDNLDWQEQTERPLGERAFKSLPPLAIFTIFRAGQGNPVIGAWLRCRDHPGEPEMLTAGQVFAATR